MYRRVMVTYDDAAASRRALAEAIKLTQNSQAQLCVLHVVDLRQVTDSTAEFSDNDSLQNSLRERGVKVLARALQTCKQAGVDAETVLAEGWEPSIAPAIVKEATQWQADMIIMGIHVRSPLASLIHTNTAEEVLKQSPLPVMLVRD